MLRNPILFYRRLGSVLLTRHLRDQGGHRDYPEHTGAEADRGQEHLHGAGPRQEGEEESPGGEHEAQPQVRQIITRTSHGDKSLFRIAYLEDQTTELQEGLKQVRDSLSRTLNTTDIIQVRSLVISDPDLMIIIQVITRLDVGSESSGLGSDRGSEGSHSPPLGQNHSSEYREK